MWCWGVHGLSMVISVSKHFRRPKGECVPLFAVETDGLEGRVRAVERVRGVSG